MTVDRRRLLKGVGGIAATSAFAGCLGSLLGGGEDGPRLWSDMSEPQEEDLEQFIGQFEEETDHELNQESVSDMDDQLETTMPAGDGPDTWAWAHDWVGRYAGRDDPPFLYDGGDDIDVDLDTFSASAQDAVSWDGSVYGLPFGSETVTLYYNKDMVDEPPETAEDMDAIMEEYYDPDGSGTYGISYNLDAYFCSPFLQAFGGTLYDAEADELGVASDEIVQGLEFLNDYIFPYMAEDPNYEAQTAVFNDGNAPFAVNGPWQLGGFRDNVDVGVTTLPTVDGNEPTPYTGVQMWYFSATLADADEEVFDAIVDWIEWYTTSEDVILNNADRHGMIPVHTEHAQNDDIDPAVQTFAEVVEMGMPMPAHPKMDDVWEPTEDALKRVFNGEQEPDEALEQAAERVRDAWE